MQVVGQPCELCEKRIFSESDGVGCARCARFFHDACLTAPPPEKEQPDTYRDPVDTKAPKKKARKRRPVCPGCGTDLRADQDARNRDAAARADAYEESRRLAGPRRSSQFPVRLAIRLILLAAVGLVALLRAMMH